MHTTKTTTWIERILDSLRSAYLILLSAVIIGTLFHAADRFASPIWRAIEQTASKSDLVLLLKGSTAVLLLSVLWSLDLLRRYRNHTTCKYSTEKGFYVDADGNEVCTNCWKEGFISPLYMPVPDVGMCQSCDKQIIGKNFKRTA
jgi:hypothetical protein